MKLNTLRFGEIEINENDILDFTDGLIGFTELTKFALVKPENINNIQWLQSLDKPEIAFPVVEAKLIGNRYSKTRGKVMYNILTIPDDITKMTANSRAPLVIDKTNTGIQQLFEGKQYRIKQFVFETMQQLERR